MPKGTGYSPINQLGPEKPTKKNLFRGTTAGPVGKSGTELDSGFRKPFPNMDKTVTGKEKGLSFDVPTYRIPK